MGVEQSQKNLSGMRTIDVEKAAHRFFDTFPGFSAFFLALGRVPSSSLSSGEGSRALEKQLAAQKNGQQRRKKVNKKTGSPLFLCLPSRAASCRGRHRTGRGFGGCSPFARHHR
jgi:hypothetical protein